ncbi:ribosome recycling factor [Candidatus Wolfebacteria bacterium]|nr:ribosome recycling factor [Candidatus Wolfebacteria bacterium]
MKESEGKIKESIEYFKNELAGIRGNRPMPKLVEDLAADSYGQKMPIKQLASISIIPPREIQISCWDKQNVQSIAKAIESSNLRVSANIDGNLIRINMPPLSQERREEIIKIVKKESEETKIKIRHIRDEANKKIGSQEEKKEISEDQKFKLKEHVQKNIDSANKEIEAILDKKIKEIEE